MKQLESFAPCNSYDSHPSKPMKPNKVVKENDESESTEMGKEKPSSVWNEKSLVEEEKPQKVVKEEGEQGNLSTEINENLLEKKNLKNDLLIDIKKTNLRIEEINVLQFVWQNFKHRKIFRNDNTIENEGKSKKEAQKKLSKKIDLNVTKPEIKQNLCKTEELRSDLDMFHDDIKEMLLSQKIISIGDEQNHTMKERVGEDLNKPRVPKNNLNVIVKQSDFFELSLNEVQSSPNDDFPKKVMKRKSGWASGVIQKKARKGDHSNEADETMGDEDDVFELSNYIEHDKKYFSVLSPTISCKLCSFKGKLIVHHYKTTHPESEVLISRLNPDIAKILIEDAVRNCEKYDKDHSELEKMTCNFKCPFCLIVIKDTSNTYYNHISSHTGEYCFHCNHCPYWTYNHTNIHSHLNEIHYKIHKTEYKMVYPDPKIFKYIFGYICSECNFIQLIRATVEKHVMLYHPGMAEIHRVNLGMLHHEKAVYENCMNEIYLNENHSNLNNCMNAVMSGVDQVHDHKLKIPVKVLSNILVQAEELKGVKLKIESKKLDEKLIEKSDKIQRDNKESENMSEDSFTQSKKDKKLVKVMETSLYQRVKALPQEKEDVSVLNINQHKEKLTTLPPTMPTLQNVLSNVLEIGPINVVKKFNVFTFHCKIRYCNYFSENKKAFATHCESVHKDFLYIFSTKKCNVCWKNFEHEGKSVTVYDIYLHIVTMHKDFFEPESDINIRLTQEVSNVLLQTCDNPQSEFPFIVTNVASLVGSPLPLTPLVTEDEEEALSSKMKLPVIASIQSLVPKAQQLVLKSGDHSKCTSVLRDTLMTDIEKQNRKCPKAVAVMMKSSFLNVLYKCPKYDCSVATMFSLPFQRHFATHRSILMNTLVPCLYCDYKIPSSCYVEHLEVKHGHCLFGCGNCFYRTTNTYFIAMHHELAHPNSEFNILHLKALTSNRTITEMSFLNLSELVLPYNCEDDGFPSCKFKTLYFDEYLKHVEAIHEVEGLGSAIMEGWLAKEVGLFQCRYCKKATVTHREMGRHQATFHSHKQCWFYYRKFVPKDTVAIPEQVNLDDPSFINHMIHLPDQVHLCDFKLTDGLLSSTSAKLIQVISRP